jgi:hypothetical protein
MFNPNKRYVFLKENGFIYVLGKDLNEEQKFLLRSMSRVKSRADKKNWLSIKEITKCDTARRNELQGKIIFGYSIYLRLFGLEII